MSFLDTIRRAKDFLQEQGRVSLRALEREFDLDAGSLDELVEELVDVQRVAAREGKVLSWIGRTEERDARSAAAREEPTPALEAERRQLTVLFCDLVGSARLAAGLDPEDWRDVVRGYQEAAAAVVERFEGHVAQYLGDGLLVYFGWPRAHEDDAERAVRVGLGIVDAIAAGDAGLAVRIGIHTGPVVVGEMGGGASRETLAMGDTTNVAARLQSEAEPGSVVLSAATLRLVPGVFLTEALGELTLKGIGRPVTAHRALRASGVRSRLDVAAAGALTPLVGREGELDLLEDRFEQVREGMGQAVVVSGEAGIGKSRIIQAFRERLAETPHTWIECRCSAYTQDSALLPVIDLLHQALSIRPDASAEEKLASLENALGFVGFDVAESLPLVTDLLSLPLREDAAAPASTPEARRRRTLSLLAEWLLRLGRQQPVVLLAEDLHWVDPSTRELLGQILEQVPTASVLALYTYRPDFESPWAGRSHVTPILLPRLTRGQVRQMVRGAARGREIPEAWVKEIMRRTDGVPLFVEELTRTLLESEALDHQGDVEDVLVAVSIPETLQDSLTARLDQLGPVKEVAQLAACLGREFSFELLLAVSPLVEGELGEALSKAVDAEVFYQRGSPPEATYLFKHALIQEAAYASLLRATRQRHHRRIAETLAKRFPEVVETRPEWVAHHLAEGGAIEPAVEHFHRAGQRAIARSAQAEAVRHLRRALDLLGSLPEGRARDARELGIQTLLGLSLVATEGYGSAAVECSFERAEAICGELGENEALFPILFGHWAFYMMRADAEVEFESAERMLAMAEHSSNTDLEIFGHIVMGVTRYWRGEFAPAREHFEQLLALHDPARHAGLALAYGQDPAVYAAGVLGLLLWVVGLPDRARAMDERAIELAEWADHPFTEAGVLGSFCTATAAQCGDFSRLHQLSERAHAIAEENGFPMFRAISEFYRAQALGARGEGEALQRMEDAIAALRSTGALRATSLFACWFAEECQRVGQPAAGLAALEGAGTFVEKHNERYWEAEVHRVRGELLLLEGARDASAEASFEKALEVARVQGARSFELRAATSLARLWQRQGRRTEARTQLQSVYDGFTEGFDTRDLKDAKALLEELA